MKQEGKNEKEKNDWCTSNAEQLTETSIVMI